MSKVNDNIPSLADILVVDDNKANLKLLESVLGEAGYKVRLANSGELALRSAQTKPPTLILLDIKMPDIDGYEVCRRLKADKKTSAIPIIFITVLESEQDKVKGFEVGCVDYVNKPINKTEVLARVQAHVSLRQAQLEIESRNASLAELNKRFETSNRLLSFLSEVNQTIVRVKNDNNLFQDICRIAVEFGKFRMAWIGLIGEESNTIEPHTHYGYEEGYLAAIHKYVNDKSSSMIPNQAAVREGKVVICDDIATTSVMLPHHREEALKRGYRSFAAIPLKLDGKVIGTFCIYAGDEGFFSSSESKLLTEIGGDVSFAMDAFATEKKHKQLEITLADSEVRYRRLFETAQDAILILNGDTGQITDANPFIKDMLGYSFEELQGKRLWEIGELKDIPLSKISYKELHEIGYKRWDDLPLVARNGRRISVEIVANAYQVDHTRVIQCNIRDMTSAHLATEALQQSEACLLATLDSTNDGILTADDNGKVLNSNRRFAEMWHIPSDMIDQHDDNVLLTYVLDQLVEPEIFLKRVKQLYTDDQRDFDTLRFKDGRIFERYSRPLVLNKASSGRVWSFRDVTGRAKAEKELQKSYAILHSVVEGTSDAVYVKDLQGKYLLCNTRVSEMVGKRVDEIIGKDDTNLFPATDAKTIMDGDHSVIESGVTMTYEELVTLADNRQHYFSSTKGTIRDNAGKVIGIFGVARDVSEQKEAEKELGLVNQDLEIAQRLTGIGSWKWIIDTNKVTWSIGLCSILGWDIKIPAPGFPEMEGLYAPESWKRLYATVSNTINTGEPYVLELDEIRTDGIRITTLTRGEADFDANGKTVGLHGTVQDITERKQAEEEIKHAAEEWRKTFDSITDLISIHSRDRRLIRVNKAFAAAFNLTPQEIIGKHCYELVHNTDKPPAYCPHTKTLIQKVPSSTEEFEPNLNMWLHVSTSPIFDEKGEVVATVHATRDITERKKTEEEIMLKAERHRIILKTAMDGIWRVDLQGRLIEVNASYCDMSGYSEQELLTMSISELEAIESADDTAAHMQKVMTEGKDRFVTKHRRKNGSVLDVEISVKYQVEEGGSLVVFIHDMTEHNKLLEQLMAQDRLVSIGQLVSGIAHEINNPMTSVVGFSDLLLQRDLPPDIKADVEIVNIEAKRTTKIVQNLLTFSRQRTEGKVLINIQESIDRVLTLRNHEQKVNNIAVNTIFVPGLPQIMANSAQLQQVFFNIIVNAEHSMLQAHNKGTLTITTEQAGETIKISIGDDGAGISQDNMKRLFTPFFTTKEVGKGTGLGLSISHGIIKDHGGRIYAESKPGEGATFIVELPIDNKNIKEQANG